MSVLEACFAADCLQLQDHLSGHVVHMQREYLALAHRHVLLGEEKRQKAGNDPPVEGRTGETNPVDLNSMSELPHAQEEKGKATTKIDDASGQTIKTEHML